jgi:hypothetical protein
MSRTLLFTGNGAEVGLFAHLLRAEGAEVTYEPPEEGRDLGGATSLVGIYVLVKATDKVTDAMLDAAIKAAKGKWRATLHREVPVQDPDEDT